MTSINQAVHVPNTTSYKFQKDASANLPIAGSPADANWQRWAMLHDGETYRMYCFKGSTKDTLYQFGWDGTSYKYGHQSEPELTITGIPDDANTNSFSMVYGEKDYHLYFQQLGNPTTLYQFLWDENTANYVPGPTLQISGFPDDTDWSRWSMLNDGNDYRIYAFKLGSNKEFYQGAWNGSEYEYGYGGSYKVLTLEGTPSNSDLANMAMLHDGSDYRFYLKTFYPSVNNPSESFSEFTIELEFQEDDQKLSGLLVNQAVYAPGTTSYKFQKDASANLPIAGSPADANWQRWAMLHDGETYRMYCFKGSTKDTLYQFGWDGTSYQYGHQSEPELTITGIPDDANTNSFSMVYGEKHYHLYFQQLGNPTTLYQFLWDKNTANYVPGPTLQISGFPNDTDWSRWSMLNDGKDYRIYAFKLGSNKEFYQGAWNGSEYEYAYEGSYKVLTLEETPSNSNLANMAMLHDGSDYRFYLKTL